MAIFLKSRNSGSNGLQTSWIFPKERRHEAIVECGLIFFGKPVKTVIWY